LPPDMSASRSSSSYRLQLQKQQQYTCKQYKSLHTFFSAVQCHAQAPRTACSNQAVQSQSCKLKQNKMKHMPSRHERLTLKHLVPPICCVCDRTPHHAIMVVGYTDRSKHHTHHTQQEVYIKNVQKNFYLPW
jgi:hypothetical protein